MRSTLAFSVSVLALRAACLSTETAAAEDAPVQAPSGRAEPDGRRAPDVPDVVDAVAIVNGEPLLRSKLREYMAPLRRRELKVTPKETRAVQRLAVQTLITDMLLDQHLRKQGYTPSEEALDAEIARIRAGYEKSREADAPTFEELLRKKGGGIEKLKKDPPPRLRFQLYVRSGVTEEPLRELFEKERRAFDGTKVRARHILIGTKGTRTKKKDREALRKSAERVRENILAGARFEELARAVSDCPTSAAGGRLKPFPRRGAMTEAFARAAFELEPGGLSPVVQTRFGFHIIKVEGFEQGRDITFDEVRSEVETLWVNRRSAEVYAEIVREAKIAPPGPPRKGTPPDGPGAHESPERSTGTQAGGTSIAPGRAPQRQPR